MINKAFKQLVFILIVICFSANIFAQSNKNDEIRLQKFNTYIQDLYLQFDHVDVHYQLFYLAMKGYFYMLKNNELENMDVLTIVDYSLSSSKKRFYVFDLKRKKVLYKSYVAHGLESGDEFAILFSNKSGTNRSCYGFFVANESYNGANGFSLRLDGKEPGVNNNARSRGIVIHGTEEADDDKIKKRGFYAQSHGCVSVPQELNREIINTLKGKSCLFVYYPNDKYLGSSKYLNNKDLFMYFENYIQTKTLAVISL